MFIMEGSILSHNDFMQKLDAILPIAGGMPDYNEPFALPAEHVLNTAFVEPDPEEGQGYNWAKSPKPKELKPYVPEHDPRVHTAALIKEAEDKVEAAARALSDYSLQIVNKICHKGKYLQRQKLESLEAKLEEAKRALRLLCGGFQ